jgi:hypothetical protein
VEVFGEAEVDVGEVDEDGGVGLVLLDGGYEAAVAEVNVGEVAEDFGDAHDGYVFGADGLMLACGGHFGASEAVEGGLHSQWGEAEFEFGDEARAVVVAGGFAGGEEDARVGCGGDDLSLVEMGWQEL